MPAVPVTVVARELIAAGGGNPVDTGNTLAASTGASTTELMARVGHALHYQYATRERDEAIAAALGQRQKYFR
jgi:hypothetical protein